MYIKEIKERLQEIRNSVGDNEKAHMLEDDLMKDFIEYICELDIEHISEMAEEIMKSDELLSKINKDKAKQILHKEKKNEY